MTRTFNKMFSLFFYFIEEKNLSKLPGIETFDHRDTEYTDGVGRDETGVGS